MRLVAKQLSPLLAAPGPLVGAPSSQAVPASPSEPTVQSPWPLSKSSPRMVSGGAGKASIAKTRKGSPGRSMVRVFKGGSASRFSLPS